jgi:site-specific recombinase XerD
MDIQAELPGIERPRQQPADPRILAKNTEACYELDFGRFRRYCEDRRLSPLPAAPKTIRDYLVHLARTKRLSTARRAICAIAFRHDHEGYDERNPARADLVRSTLRGLLTAADRRGPMRKAAIVSEGVRTIIARIYADPFINQGQALRALRDHAIFLILFAGSLRRDESRTLVRENIQLTNDAMILHVRASSDREPRSVTILRGPREEVDPVGTIAKWLAAANIHEGVVFPTVYDDGRVGEVALSQGYFSRMIKGRCENAGIDPTLVSPQSLCNGFVAAAAAGGASTEQILKHTGRRDPRHIEELIATGRAWANHPQRFLLL